MIEPEDDGGGDRDSGHEGVGASIVAGVYAPPVLEPSEHVLDSVPLAIEFAVMVDGLLAIGSGRDAGRDAAFGEGFSEPVGVIAFVAQNSLAFGRTGSIIAAPL